MLSSEQYLAYERWANRRVLERLRNFPEIPDRAAELFAHALAGITVWLTRLQDGDSSGIAIWPKSTLADCAKSLSAVESLMSDTLRKLEGTSLDQNINYTNQHGLSYVTSVRDILFHLASHGAYHRGQVSIVLRESGLEPVNTDYITFVREQA